MAEASQKLPPPSGEQSDRSDNNDIECAVCLQPYIHPARLPCDHIFCFLCIKGIVNQGNRCAICRREIPRNFVEEPNLLQRPTVNDFNESFDGGFQWFYEGRNGWWQYDERTSKELELYYKKGDKTCELLIAGFLYIIDFENMLQLRRNDASRRRRIKRDFSTIPKKGIAGLRTNNNNDETGNLIDNRPVEGRTDNIIPITPSNTPQSPTSGRESPHEETDLQATIERISSLHLEQL